MAVLVVGGGALLVGAISLNIPYWRTLKIDGYLNEKYPGGVLTHKKLIEQEGFTVLSKGKKYFVKDFEKYLFQVIS